MVTIDVDEISSIVESVRNQLTEVKDIHKEADDKVDDMREKV